MILHASRTNRNRTSGKNRSRIELNTRQKQDRKALLRGSVGTAAAAAAAALVMLEALIEVVLLTENQRRQSSKSKSGCKEAGRGTRRRGKSSMRWIRKLPSGIIGMAHR
jgi:hypothetical protein